MIRRLNVLLLLMAMVGFGIGVNRYIAQQKSTVVTQKASKPTETRAKFVLPGTIFVAQQGQIYALHAGNFTRLPLPKLGDWMQPYVLPDGSLLTVAHQPSYSDLYHISADGKVLAQLTHNHVSDKTIQLNHWVYWPSATADGLTVFASHDRPKPALNASYEIDFSIWSGPLAGNVVATRQTTPDPYTGGDIQPAPLPGGGLLYVTYSMSADSHAVAQLAFQATPRSNTVVLTSPEDGCSSAAVAPDGSTIAMVCTADTQTAKLKIAHLVGGKLDTPTVLVDSCLCSAPVWAPDGSGLLYLAPSDATGHFQMWWVKNAGLPTAAPPKQVTRDVDLDANSAPTWYLPAPSPAPGGS